MRHAAELWGVACACLNPRPRIRARQGPRPSHLALCSRPHHSARRTSTLVASGSQTENGIRARLSSVARERRQSAAAVHATAARPTAAAGAAAMNARHVQRRHAVHVMRPSLRANAPPARAPVACRSVSGTLGAVALFMTPGALTLAYAAYKGKGNMSDGLSHVITAVSQGYLQPDAGGKNIPVAEGDLSEFTGSYIGFLYQMYVLCMLSACLCGALWRRGCSGTVTCLRAVHVDLLAIPHAPEIDRHALARPRARKRAS